MRYPCISARAGIQQAYEAMRDQGTGHRLAEMLALGQPPAACSDREFLLGRCNGNQFEKTPYIGDEYAAEAKRRGVDISGKIYVHGLADYPGDPRAWVGGRGDVQKVCAERGWGCEGLVDVKARQEGSGGLEVGLDPALVEAEVASILNATPDPAAVDRDDLAEQVKQKRKPHWVK